MPQPPSQRLPGAFVPRFFRSRRRGAEPGHDPSPAPIVPIGPSRSRPFPILSTDLPHPVKTPNRIRSHPQSSPELYRPAMRTRSGFVPRPEPKPCPIRSCPPTMTEPAPDPTPPPYARPPCFPNPRRPRPSGRGYRPNTNQPPTSPWAIHPPHGPDRQEGTLVPTQTYLYGTG